MISRQSTRRSLLCWAAASLALQFAPAQSAVEPARPAAHWAFVAPVEPPPVSIRNDAWSRQPLDRFVMRRLEAANMQPSPPADARGLIRRLSLDLTGLPPTRAEVRAFLAEAQPGAYERLVDRLLASPHYGEHMARHWLDLVRFADTNGMHHDHYREMSPYRDWVIRAFNDNLPYDEFLTDQLAGDLRPEPTDEQRIASGFHRLHMIIDAGTALPEESHARNVIDRVTAFGTAFLGLTVQCAVCHDHKYDPIEQEDFYRLSAFFNNLDGAPETGGRGTPDFRRGLQPPYVEFPDAAQAAALADLAPRIDAAATRLEELENDPKAVPELQNARKELQRLRREQTAVLMGVPAAMVMKERAEVRPAHVFIRGNYADLGPRVERGTPAFLPPLPPGDGVRTRLELAEWLVSPAQPLTARVAVNRIWQQLFGVGIVKTTDDFGTQGERPSHPQLLDHLAVSFVESGWNVKALVRQIVLSSTYRQSSRATPASFERDPENRLLARGSRFRLDAEVIRDQILASSGLLNRELYGKSVRPPQPPGIWLAVTLPDSFPRKYTPDSGPQIVRRSIYTFWKRGMPPPQMSILNAPTRESCTARRERTNTPLQALLLLNESEYLRAARHLARATLAGGAGSAVARLDVVYEAITSALPDPEERDMLLSTVADLRTMYDRDPALAEALCDDVQLEGGQSPAELAAWTMLASTIYNLDITKTRQ